MKSLTPWYRLAKIVRVGLCPIVVGELESVKMSRAFISGTNQPFWSSRTHTGGDTIVHLIAAEFPQPANLVGGIFYVDDPLVDRVRFDSRLDGNLID